MELRAHIRQGTPAKSEKEAFGISQQFNFYFLLMFTLNKMVVV